jgi:hypothetical protein
MSEIHKESFIDLAGGRIRCRRCQALSKRSRQQCKKPALKGKSVCDFHGGRSSGPQTPEGRQRVVEAKTTHAKEGRATRKQRSATSAHMRELEDVAWALNMMRGARTRGRKPTAYRPVKTLEEAKLWVLKDASKKHQKVKF